MSRRTIAIIILFATVSLAAIVAGQVFWVKNAYSYQEKQFNDRVVIAMTSVVKRILTINRDPALTEPVKQLASNYFVANINDTLHPYLLETLLKEEFTKSNLHEEFEYGIYDCFNDSIVYGGRVDFEDLGEKHAAEQIKIQTKLDQDGHYFGVLFPNKTATILKKLDFWMYSSLLILLIIVFFTYTMIVILKQKRLSEVKTDFINNMTHELKTPISTIQLSASVLMQGDIANQPERLHQYASIISHENHRLKSQVDKVLQIATLTPGKVHIKKEILDLDEIIQRAVETFEISVQEAEGTLRYENIAKTTTLSGDPVHITNVVYNLLDNALKYRDKPPEIFIQLRNEGDQLKLMVRDNGIGISEKYIKSIFEKFYRVPTGNLHDVKGFGLGLYYVHTIVRAHKGKIDVESVKDQGSTFTITFETAS